MVKYFKILKEGKAVCAVWANICQQNVVQCFFCNLFLIYGNTVHLSYASSNIQVIHIYSQVIHLKREAIIKAFWLYLGEEEGFVFKEYMVSWSAFIWLIC